MRRVSSESLKSELEQLVKSFGAYKTGVASANTGFDNALEGCHPRDVMKNCNSVVVFGLYVGDDYYCSIQLENRTKGDSRIMHLLRDWIQYRAATWLQKNGYRAKVPIGFYRKEDLIASLSYKLAAYEAGLGVYGRCGIIITPEYGPKVNFGVVLTDVDLEHDSKLANFNPCHKCRVCIDMCPSKAVQLSQDPVEGFDREACVNFVQRLRGKTDDRTFLCGYCYDNCPIGKTSKPGFKLSRYRTLATINPCEREVLLQRVSTSS